MLLDLTAIARKDYEHSRRVCQPFFAPPCPGRRNPKVPSPRDMVAALFSIRALSAHRDQHPLGLGVGGRKSRFVGKFESTITKIIARGWSVTLDLTGKTHVEIQADWRCRYLLFCIGRTCDGQARDL
jgi:hypothetical protein